MRRTTMTWRQIVPTLVTLAAMMCGFFSILVTLESMDKINSGMYHRWAAQLIMLAMILDGLDGNLARRLKGCSDLGSELDTYVDMTAFGIAPAVLIYAVTLQNTLVWRVIMTTAVVLSGVLRLARFKAMDPDRGQRGFSGLPITACAAWVSILVYISQSEPLNSLSLNQGGMALVFLLGVLLFIVLQVSNIRYPKPTTHAAIFVPGVLLVTFLFLPWNKLVVVSAWTILVLDLVYVIAGPFYMQRIAVKDRCANNMPRENCPSDPS